MRTTTVLAAAALTVAGVACSETPEPSEPVFEEARSALSRDTSAALSGPDSDVFASGNTAFALRLHKKTAEAKGNVALSPYSISTALAMTYAGARGATATQMEEVLGFDLRDKTHVGMNALEHALAARAGEGKAIDGSPLKLAVNNAVFSQKGLTFEPAYLDTIGVQYGAGIKLADFARDPSGERARINAWVASKTENRIKDLLGALASTTRVVLVNTIYMNAAWETPFDANDTSDGTFTNEDGTSATVKMMRRASDLTTATTDEASLVTLPYSGGKLTMTAILPKKGTLAEFEQALDAKGLDALLTARTTSTASVVVPRFKLAGESVSLKTPLVALGMTHPFADADFSGMSKEGLYIRDVVHKAFIDVAEKGTEAAAATAVVMLEKAAATQNAIVFNRPFLVLIRDEPTGAILFTARVASL